MHKFALENRAPAGSRRRFAKAGVALAVMGASLGAALPAGAGLPGLTQGAALRSYVEQALGLQDPQPVTPASVARIEHESGAAKPLDLGSLASSLADGAVGTDGVAVQTVLVRSAGGSDEAARAAAAKAQATADEALRLAKRPVVTLITPPKLSVNTATATTAESVADGAIGTDQLASGSVTPDKLAGVIPQTLIDTISAPGKIDVSALPIIPGSKLGAGSVGNEAVSVLSPTKIAGLTQGTVSLLVTPSASQTIAYGAADVSTILREAQGATAAPLVVQDSTGTQLFAVDPSGLITTASVNSGSVVDGSLLGIDLAPGTVGTTQLGDGSVTAAKLATGSVGTAAVAPGAIQLIDLAPGSVDASKIVSGTIGDAEIAGNAGIAYSKLSLRGKIALSDLSAATLAALQSQAWSGSVLTSPTASQTIDYGGSCGPACQTILQLDPAQTADPLVVQTSTGLPVFAVSKTGGVTQADGLTIQSGGASITGNVSVAGNSSVSGAETVGNGLTVSAGGASITGNSSVSGNSTVGGTLGVTGAATLGGGASVSGGLNNNSGGITNAGAISGATTGSFSGAVTLTANANALALTGTAAATTHALLELGSGFAGGANGTYFGVNAANGFTGNLLDLRLNGTSKLSVDANGNLVNAGSATVGNGLTVSAGGAAITGNSSVSGNSTVGGNSSVTGSQTVGNGLTVSAGGASITGNSSVSGNSTVGGNSSVTGSQTVGNGLTVSAGGASITGNSSVSGNSTVGGTLGVTGAATLSGGASVTGGLNNNSGGITNAGAISGITTADFSGAVTLTANANALA
ncbi:MAG: hypothetical protein JO073_06170, partial [Actinobacteria bacterium]|nr:hypothetical protein [Actinomycetota bacterium]